MLSKPKSDAISIIMGKLKDKQSGRIGGTGSSKEDSGTAILYKGASDKDETPLDEKVVAAEELLEAMEQKDAEGVAVALCALIDLHTSKKEDEEEEEEEDSGY
jgi:hypothetical protein